jgi:hypothetical protein
MAALSTSSNGADSAHKGKRGGGGLDSILMSMIPSLKTKTKSPGPTVLPSIAEITAAELKALPDKFHQINHNKLAKEGLTYFMIFFIFTIIIYCMSVVAVTFIW